MEIDTCDTSYNLCRIYFSLDARQFLIKLCAEKGVECSPPQTTSRLLDKVPHHNALIPL